MSSPVSKCTSSSPLVAPPAPKCRRSLRSEGIEESCSLNNNFQSLQMEEKTYKRRTTSNQSEAKDQSYDKQMTESSSEENEETAYLQNHSRTTSPYSTQNRSRTTSPYSTQNRSRTTSPYSTQNRSRTTSSYSTQNRSRSNSPHYPQNRFSPERKNDLTKCINKNESNTSSCSYIIKFFFFVIVPVALSALILLNKNNVQTQSISNPTLLLAESIKNIKTTFYNQELDIWNDISSAINEVISSIPKTPSIILLFAKETATMDCLATKLAQASSTILHADSYLVFNPEDFGNDAGEIITTLNNHSLERKKVVMIRDILNINAEAIKALHNLCDRVNPLVAEAIYILTMQTNNYQSSQKKLKFVENQISNKLSKSIDQDVLLALVTRITDGAIISVQPEPELRYC
ncbi:uncharacterized protein LOC105194736 isoform X1 [Solenopsis invicta]|uniref:uncharacterized protein LOC105194736 isoform X1 n=1 Tax=Solenopsis invicta TaxID=13686 RepID=UPI000E33FEE4|nr:uncharacterized protein LOC105194736 isoform X1 [Solenopsis invicta]